MTTSSPLAQSPRSGPDPLRAVVPVRVPDGGALRALDPVELRLGTLFVDPRLDELVRQAGRFADSIGAPFDVRAIPVSLARAGTVGRIGVPRQAMDIMHRQRVVLSAFDGVDPLSPAARLWRGMQRRADVMVDVHQCTTLPGSAAAAAGMTRDVLLFSKRLIDVPARRAVAESSEHVAQHWTRARHAAELAYRLAMTERRTLYLAQPVGRGTDAQHYFADALQRHARLIRATPPRLVKAGLLAALLGGAAGRERCLVASVMPMDELRVMTREAIGDTGPWPVLSFGHDASFYDMPATVPGAAVDPLPLLLVVASLLQRSGRAELARTLLQSSLTTVEAAARMREELGTDLTVPTDAFMRGVHANWGRSPVSLSAPGAHSGSAAMADAVGLRVRVETTLTAPALRERVTRTLQSVGLEVASVRSVEGRVSREQPQLDLRLRPRLGEPALADGASRALSEALGDTARIVSVEPWTAAEARTR